MGSTSLHREPGQSDRAFFEAEFPDTLTQRGEILACATIGGTFYAAVRDKDSGSTWALIILIIRSRGYWNFTYKEMDETMGPAEDRCPARILDLLSPTDREYALDWRGRCRQNAARLAQATAIRPGDTVRFSCPLAFANGDRHDTFLFEKRSTFRHPQDTTRYRIPGWRDRYDYQVIPSRPASPACPKGAAQAGATGER
jgi:hypothetical protein